MKGFITCLWFDTQAEEAARFYTSIFKHSTLDTVTHYGKEGYEIHGKPEGSVLTVDFTLEGQRFQALNGGPNFKFNESVSIVINCETQEEIDYYWQRLGEEGDPSAQQCGWLKDKYGLSWQLSPVILEEMMRDPDKTKTERLMAALLKMKKLDISILQKAFSGEE